VLAGCCALFVLSRAAARRSRDDVAALAGAILTLAAVESALGLAQAAGVLEANAAGADWVARGTFVNRNHFSVLLEAGLCIAFGLGVFARGTSRPVDASSAKGRLAGSACGLAAGVCVAGIAASGSRMGILIAFATALGGWVVFRRPRRPFSRLSLNLAVVALVATLSFPGASRGFERLLEDNGDPGRLAIWPDALAAADRHLATGSGLGTFALAFQRGQIYFPRNAVDHAHSDWLEFLVEMGLGGALFTGVTIVCAFAYCLRPYRLAVRDPLQIGFLLGAGVILLHSTVDFPLQIPALAALFAVLLGSAAGLADRSRRCAPGPRGAVVLSALGCFSFAILAAAVACGRPPSWDAESLFASGQRELLVGRAALAEQKLRDALAANPYSALAWQKRAEVDRMRGQYERAHGQLELAARLEPFTFRAEWPLAQSLLQRRRWEPAAARLARLAEAMPDVRPAILRSALEAGMPPALIDRSVVPRDGAGVWLRALADRAAWQEFEESLTRRMETRIDAPPGELRYLFDRLFQGRQPRLMKTLWRAVRPEETFGLFPLRPALGASNDSFGLADTLNSGFGFQWVAHPARGVGLRLDAGRQTTRFEFDFRAPEAEESVHLSRYFAVAPSTDYILKAPVSAEGFGGGEAVLEVWSAQGLLGSSAPVRTPARRHVAVRFRSGALEQVLQLRFVSRNASRLTAIHGKLVVGPFQLESSQPTLQDGT
jgi:O-antigen ligase